AVVAGAAWYFVVGMYVLLSILAPRVAYADNVDTLIGQLSDSSPKVRLSAALSLTKIGDARAISAFAGALAKDPDKNVRATLAVGLGVLVTDKVKPAQRTAVISALTRAQKDENEFVRKQADKALASLKGGAGTAEPAVAAGAIYLELGPMASKVKETALDFPGVMRKTSQKTVAREAKDMATTWPGGKSPTKAQLDQKSVQGFYLDGTLIELTTKEKGSSTIVSCKVSMLIATLPDKSMFGFLNGSASVDASTDPADVAEAKKDCIDAVVEDLVTKKVLPTIKTKAGQ
nr:HEAT repeat domain-containing protein [Kofleriaceae bacterium]